MKKTPIRLRYFSLLSLLLLVSHLILFAILCLMEFRKTFYDASKFPEALDEVGVYFVVVLISLPLSITLAWRISRNLLQPLNTMTRTAEQISGGDFSKRIQISRSYDVLDRLATSFNLAFDHYEQVLERLEHFNTDAAHQLRTPLAAIRSTGETALLSTRSPEEYARVIGHMLEELRRLTGTVDQLLQLAQLGSGTLCRSFVTFRPADSIRIIVERFAPLAESKHIALETDLDDAPTFQGNPELAEQAIANLLDNAIRHTPEQGTIRIVQHDGTIVIEDSGPGIPAALLSTIFEPFRSAGATGQSGLGLAIAQRIVQLHGGTLYAENRPAGGARLTITFVPSPSLKAS